MAGQKVQLVITVDENGNVQVSGPPIENKLVAYGLLELARDAIKDWHDKRASRIVQAQPADVLQMRKPGT